MDTRYVAALVFLLGRASGTQVLRVDPVISRLSVLIYSCSSFVALVRDTRWPHYLDASHLQ
ncbi:hypothetical protein M404DRAFT_616188 [Pisolithus tinctorius Marx 270]|uniref:Uncharacterized protein n=1 Tax=Pisolithus tinctorius Marx 270 TaxID=870435 RepID=A0A0C3P7T8_PISTI|nr:hypothetical protein M404DRAFT_616188 [Pisolithus tinctorius Marx 270]